jgi:hypothetical protein
MSGLIVPNDNIEILIHLLKSRTKKRKSFNLELANVRYVDPRNRSRPRLRDLDTADDFEPRRHL